MNFLNLLLKIKCQMWLNRMSRLKPLDWFKIFFFGGLTILFFYGLYSGFYRFLMYLETIPIIGKLLSIKLLAMTFLSFFSMLIFSNMIASFTTLFFARDLPVLLTSPVSFRKVFFFKFIETSFYSSWSIVIALLPFILAYGKVKSLVWYSYFGIGFLSIPFFLIATSIGVLITLLLVYYFPSTKTRDALFLLAVMLGAILYLLIRFLQPEEFIKPDKLEEVIQYINVIQAPTAAYLPSWWITEIINSFTLHKYQEIIFYAVLLIGTAIICTTIVLFVAEKIYYHGWNKSHESVSRKGIKPNIFWKITDICLSKSSPVFRAVLVKDLKLFFRDTSQWSQLLLLIALLVVYLFNIYKLPLDNFYLKNLAAFFNIGIAGFTLAAVALRFVFPAISLEKNSFWVIRSAPLSSSQLIKEKFLITLAPIIILSTIISLVSNWILKVDIFVFLLSTITLFFATIVICAMGTGLGAIYPRFEVENIAQIESSFGGILYMGYSLFFLGLNLGLLALPMRMYFNWRMGMEQFSYPLIIIVSVIILAIDVLVFGVSMYYGKKAMDNYEK